MKKEILLLFFLVIAGYARTQSLPDTTINEPDIEDPYPDIPDDSLIISTLLPGGIGYIWNVSGILQSNYADVLPFPLTQYDSYCNDPFLFFRDTIN